MEQEQRDGSWQEGINNSLEAVWRNHWECQVKKLNLWQNPLCLGPCHQHLLLQLYRGGTTGTWAEMAPYVHRERSGERGSHLCLTFLAAVVGTGAITSTLTPELSTALHDQRSLCPAAASAETSPQHIYQDREQHFLRCHCPYFGLFIFLRLMPALAETRSPMFIQQWFHFRIY